MFLSFCSVLFSSLVSIQWLCLFLTIPMFRFDPSDVYRATLKWSRVFDLPDNSYRTRKWRWQVWSYTRNLNPVILFFFLSRITELWFSDAWQFKNYREIIIAALIHIGFVIFVWLQKTAVLSSYYGPPNSGPRNAHTELDGVSGLPISLKYLGVHKKKRKSFHPTLSDMFTR